MVFNLFNTLVCACAFATISSAQVVPCADDDSACWDVVFEADEAEFQSVVSVLKTALPEDVLPRISTAYDARDIYLSAASDLYLATVIVDSMPDATDFPDWFLDLPSAVQTFLGPKPLTPTANTPDFDQLLTSGGPEQVAILSVLQTAIPPSLLEKGLTDYGAYLSEFASAFDSDASTYPTWVSALPTNVLAYFEIELETALGATLIVPQQTSNVASGTTVQTSAITVTSTTLASITKPPRTTTTATQTIGGTTMTTTGGGGGVGGDVPGGAAAMPMMGTGAVILVGVVGLMAL
ncbi:unnamed protein product [Zymoseptoria tritici ST99CH_1A5]|uniref:Uncharacterized protein n=1 Tax=Zymoseptoria tritici ST99CH_1A5 TaxID=1276529 RepID=A0A1Y6L817_ZYMTR|nr:unnamed protein product [Zymoseptoria tritici ST99CH_1A5]